MSKHLDSLEVLCSKMQVRYGINDDLVLELRQEIAVLREKKIKDQTKKHFGRHTDEKQVAAHPVH